MHAGLLTHHNRAAPALAEAHQTAGDLADLGDVAQTQAQVAILFDYTSSWAWETQPQGRGFDYFRLVFSAYRAMRRAGLSVDFVSSNANPSDGYKLILAPGLATLDDNLMQRIAEGCDLGILGPRTGAINQEFLIPDRGRPGVKGFDCDVDLVETLPPNVTRPVQGGGAARHWMEHLSGSALDLLSFDDGTSALKDGDGLWYLAGDPDDVLWDRIINLAARKTGLTLHQMPDGLRRRETSDRVFLINYGAKPVEWHGRVINGCDVAILEHETTTSGHQN